MPKQRKCHPLRGKRQRFAVECRNCGHHKVIEVRRDARKERRVCGVKLLTNTSESP